MSFIKQKELLLRSARIEAVGFYNKLQKRKIISRQLQKECKTVQEESMKVLAEFEKLQDED